MHITNNRKSMLFMALALFFPCLSHAEGAVRPATAAVEQQTACTGVVLDADGNPIIGASIKVENGDKTGAVTDLDGKFTIANVNPGATLNISYIGFKTKLVVWEGKPLTITMSEDSETLQDVVVIGYGTQKKVNLTGAVSAVTAKDLEGVPVDNTSFWKTEQDALMGLTACYDALQSDHLYDDYLDGGGYGFLMRETTSDNGEHSWGTWMQGSTVAMGTSGTNDGCFRNYWNANYELIKRCNLLISNMDGAPMDKDVAGGYKAEALALRALGYCNLVSLYRDVPYLEKPLTLKEAEAPVEKKDVIAEKVLADLAANIPYLPVRGKEKKGRMCREAAYAIMGRMALFTGNYDKAIEAYKNVIGAYSLFKAGDGTDYHKNYAELFTEANETCNEVILGVHYMGPGLGEGQTFSICWGVPMTAVQASMNLCDEYYCTDGLPIDKSPLFKGNLAKGGHSMANIDYPRFENRDPRMKATLAVPGTEWQKGMIVGSEATKNSFNKSTVYIRKWFIPNKTTNEYDGSLDYYVIRYAEVLLSLAEAMIEKGGYSQAEITPYINEVRARVGMPAVEKVEGSGLSRDELRKIVRHERRVELAFEDLRLADLYRWNDWENSVKRMLRDKEWYGATCYDHAYRGPQDDVWPIPQSEIDTNKKLEQHAEWK